MTASVLSKNDFAREKPGTNIPGFCVPCMSFTFRVKVPSGPGWQEPLVEGKVRTVRSRLKEAQDKQLF